MSEINVKLGELIKLERERRNINLEDFSTQLKISYANLESIESGDAKKLPSDLYFNLFAKSCCEALGIDFVRTIDAIKMELAEDAASKEDSSNSNTKGKSKTHTDHSQKDEKLQFKKLAYMFGGVVGVFILFMVIYLLFFKGDDPDPQISNQSDNKAVEQTDDNTGIAEAYDWNTSAYNPPTPLELKLTASQESWATILADGDTTLFRSLVPGRQYTINADYRLQISVGIPRYVEIELNGTKVDLVNPESRRISKVKINQMNLKSFLEPKIEKIINNSSKDKNKSSLESPPATSSTENINTVEEGN